MSDYISREMTIEAMYKEAEAHPGHTFWTSQFEALRNIPAADVRPVVRGKWEEEDSASNRQSFRCSVCGKGGRGYKFNFCSNCGADMREES